MHNNFKLTGKQILEFVFYGNYFYGICIVCLMLETTVQFNLILDGILIFIMAFIATVLFYNYPYARNRNNPGEDPRTMWFDRNHKFVMTNQILFSIALSLCTILIVVRHHEKILEISFINWLLLLSFPIAGAFYYGSNFLHFKYNLRQIGWLKPFTIGFVWAGVANIYPIFYSYMINSKHFELNVLNSMLFLKTMMFTSMLAIMFDIKDYVADSKSELNTLIVKLGLRKTIFFVTIPLTLLGLLTFISYALTHHFSILKMILTMMPYILLIAASRTFTKRRPLLYYLIVIDGLFIVKSFFDILATFA